MHYKWNHQFVIAIAFLIFGSGIAMSCLNGSDDDNSDHSDAAWTDASTGLTWQSARFEEVEWKSANQHCDDLQVSGFDDWRLPSISELRTLVRGCAATESGGSCGVTDDCAAFSDDEAGNKDAAAGGESRADPKTSDDDGDPPPCADHTCLGCDVGDGPNDGCFGVSELEGECDWYWSSSVITDIPEYPWILQFTDAKVFACFPDNSCDGSYSVRCVR
ncbi:DUF1566 domain-containing protein [bacterium]|nr:DUF1566 domain-containing protein [bacterium]